MDKKRLYSSIFFGSLLAIPSVLAQNAFEPISNILVDLAAFASSPENGPWISGVLVFIFYIGLVQATIGKKFEGQKGAQAIIWAVGLALSFGVIRLAPDILEITGPIGGVIFIIFGGFFIYRFFSHIEFGGKNDKMLAASISFFVIWVAGMMLLGDTIEGPWSAAWALVSLLAALSLIIFGWRLIKFVVGGVSGGSIGSGDYTSGTPSEARTAFERARKQAIVERDIENIERESLERQLKNSVDQINDLNGIVAALDRLLGANLALEKKSKLAREVVGRISKVIMKEDDLSKEFKRVDEGIVKNLEGFLYNNIEGNLRKAFDAILVEHPYITIVRFTDDVKKFWSKIENQASRIRSKLGSIKNSLNGIKADIQQFENIMNREVVASLQTKPPLLSRARQGCVDAINFKNDCAKSFKVLGTSLEEVKKLNAVLGISMEVDTNTKLPRGLTPALKRAEIISKNQQWGGGYNP